MPELEEFLPIFPEETEETVMDRVLEWLNDGVDPSEQRWVDPREGGMARTLLVPAVREIAVLYDRISVEVPAAAHPLFAWGTYLDQWALALGTERLAPTPADGVVRFRAKEFTVIPEGTEVGLEEGAEASYYTVEEVMVAEQIDPGPPMEPITVGVVDVAVVATATGTVGNVSAGAVTAILSYVSDPEATVTNQQPMEGGTDEESDEQLRARVLGIYAGSPSGGNVDQYEQWVRALPGVGNVNVSPEGEGPGTVVIFATATDGEPVGDATRKQIRDYLDPPAVDMPMMGGTTATTIEMASTNGFRDEGIVHTGQEDLSSDTIHNYTGRTATELTGVTPAPSFIPLQRVWQTGRGGGRAPVGHHVVVTTGTVLLVVISATVEMNPGYALSSASNEIDLTTTISEALASYVDALAPGEEIVLRRVEATVLGVVGVHDIGLTKINAVAANYQPDSTEVPKLDQANLDLTEGSIT